MKYFMVLVIAVLLSAGCTSKNAPASGSGSQAPQAGESLTVTATDASADVIAAPAPITIVETKRVLLDTMFQGVPKGLYMLQRTTVSRGESVVAVTFELYSVLGSMVEIKVSATEDWAYVTLSKEGVRCSP